jgi:hypothetical protein
MPAQSRPTRIYVASVNTSGVNSSVVTNQTFNAFASNPANAGRVGIFTSNWDRISATSLTDTNGGSINASAFATVPSFYIAQKTASGLLISRKINKSEISSLEYRASAVANTELITIDLVDGTHVVNQDDVFVLRIVYRHRVNTHVCRPDVWHFNLRGKAGANNAARIETLINDAVAAVNNERHVRNQIIAAKVDANTFTLEGKDELVEFQVALVRYPANEIMQPGQEELIGTYTTTRNPFRGHGNGRFLWDLEDASKGQWGWHNRREYPVQPIPYYTDRNLYYATLTLEVDHMYQSSAPTTGEEYAPQTFQLFIRNSSGQTADAAATALQTMFNAQ